MSSVEFVKAFHKLMPAAVLAFNLAFSELVRFTNNNSECKSEEQVTRLAVFVIVCAIGILFLEIPKIDDTCCHYSWAIFKVVGLVVWIISTTPKYLVCALCNSENTDSISRGKVNTLSFATGAVVLVWGFLAFYFGADAEFDEGNPKEMYSVAQWLRNKLKPMRPGGSAFLGRSTARFS